MIISDLNLLETVESSEIVGGKFTSIYFNEYYNIYKDIDAKANVKGNIATADASAYGKNTLTQVFTTTTPYSSQSSSVSVSD
ncbi:hypothetical protein NIES2107_17940 [Nostoc carneum NIES-2107]|nr:hypothetical protein NIES2107_17940 [Nostoc carneum NIES-2107]